MKSWFYGLCVRGDGAQVLLEIIRGMMKRKFCFRGGRACRCILMTAEQKKPLRFSVKPGDAVCVVSFHVSSLTWASPIAPKTCNFLAGPTRTPRMYLERGLCKFE